LIYKRYLDSGENTASGKTSQLLPVLVDPPHIEYPPVPLTEHLLSEIAQVSLELLRNTTGIIQWRPLLSSAKYSGII